MTEVIKDAVTNWESYTSRKFLIVMLTLTYSFLMTAAGKFPPELSLIFISAVTSYSVANAWVDTENFKKYHSRKFIVTILTIHGSLIFAWFEILKPELANFVTVAIGAYNMTVAWRTSRNAEGVSK